MLGTLYSCLSSYSTSMIIMDVLCRFEFVKVRTENKLLAIMYHLTKKKKEKKLGENEEVKSISKTNFMSVIWYIIFKALQRMVFFEPT